MRYCEIKIDDYTVCFDDEDYVNSLLVELTIDDDDVISIFYPIEQIDVLISALETIKKYYEGHGV